jgi:hypothetical protein
MTLNYVRITSTQPRNHLIGDPHANLVSGAGRGVFLNGHARNLVHCVDGALQDCARVLPLPQPKCHIERGRWRNGWCEHLWHSTCHASKERVVRKKKLVLIVSQIRTKMWTSQIQIRGQMIEAKHYLQSYMIRSMGAVRVGRAILATEAWLRARFEVTLVHALHDPDKDPGQHQSHSRTRPHGPCTA